MSAVAVSLSPEDRRRLEALSARIGLSLEACAQQAVQDFIGHWEDYLRTLETLGSEERPVLRSVNE